MAGLAYPGDPGLDVFPLELPFVSLVGMTGSRNEMVSCKKADRPAAQLANAALTHIPVRFTPQRLATFGATSRSSTLCARSTR